ncbi:hypothetical protein Emag_001199 [Eimeria magna]
MWRARRTRKMKHFLLVASCLARACSTACAIYLELKAAPGGMGSLSAATGETLLLRALPVPASSAHALFVATSPAEDDSSLAQIAQQPTGRTLAERLARLRFPGFRRRATGPSETGRLVTPGAGEPSPSPSRPPGIKGLVRRRVAGYESLSEEEAGTSRSVGSLFGRRRSKGKTASEQSEYQGAAFGGALSEEESRAAQEGGATQEKALKEAIQHVMNAALQRIQIDRRNLELRRGLSEQKVWMHTIHRLTHGRGDQRIAVLKDIRDAPSGRHLVSECAVQQTRFLENSGTAVTIEAEILGEECKNALRMDRVTLKAMYSDAPASEKDQFAEQCKNVLKSQVEFSRSVEAALTPGESLLQKLEKNHWIAPIFLASLGHSPEHVYSEEKYMINSSVLLTAPVLGDSTVLLYSKEYQVRARIPMAARQYLCGEIVKSAAQLHAMGIVHYSITPDNILLAPDGSVHLSEFTTWGHTGMPRRCNEGFTHFYIDPAQAKCIEKEKVLPLSEKLDTWSVGMVCYLMITAKSLPYSIDQAEDLLKYIRDLDFKAYSLKRIPPSGNPEEELKEAGASALWAQIVSSMLDVRREKRPSLSEILQLFPNWTQKKAGKCSNLNSTSGSTKKRSNGTSNRSCSSARSSKGRSSSGSVIRRDSKNLVSNAFVCWNAFAIGARIPIAFASAAAAAFNAQSNKCNANAAAGYPRTAWLLLLPVLLGQQQQGPTRRKSLGIHGKRQPVAIPTGSSCKSAGDSASQQQQLQQRIDLLLLQGMLLLQLLSLSSRWGSEEDSSKVFISHQELATFADAHAL